MKVPTFTFAGGVLSRGLWGRVDLQKYQTGLKAARNFIIAIEGGAEKRFGTYLTGKRKYQTADKPAKLIPWRIANDDSYMLEVGDEYIRFIRLGGYVTIPDGHISHEDSIAANVDGYMEIATPYQAADVRKLKFTFANDIMYLNLTGYPEYQLVRLGLYDWNFLLSDFAPHPAWTGGGEATWENHLIEPDNYTPVPVNTEYKISATLADGIETRPSAVIAIDADTGHQRLWVHLEWDAVAGAIQYTVYKGKNGIYGFIGYTTELEYDDRNIAPSYDVVPLDKVLTFPDNPGVSEFYKQRKVYAGFALKPQNFIISKPLIFNSLYKSIPSQSDDAIEATLVGRERHSINHMIELRKFVIFTDTAEWVLGTTENAALSAATLDPTIETKYGADPWLRPIVIGDRILFVQNISGNIRDMGYEFTTDAFKADDLTRLSRDLFRNKETIAWDSAPFPLNLVPCVVTGGMINNLSYAREHEIWGWTDMDTRGEFLDVASVAEVSENAIYYQVKRTLNGSDAYFIERLEVNYNNRLEDMVYMDCALTFKQELSFANLERISDTEIIFEVPDHNYDLEDEIQLEFSDESILRVRVQSLAVDAVTASPLQVSKFPETILPEGSSYICVSQVTNLDHLDNEEVWVLADGKVFKKLQVVEGILTLPSKFCRVHVGLPYSTYLETLNLDINQAQGGYNERTIGDIILHLRDSRGVWAGPSASPHDLENIPSRNDENMYYANALLNGPYELPTHVDWQKTAGVRIESRDPLPCNVLNIVPDIKYGS